jgi:nucleoside recognition membrane protein YjiH
MKLWKNKLFWRFLIPSLVGIFLFVTPVQYEGNISIPIAVAAGIFQNLLGEYAATVIWAIISASALVTIFHKIFRIPFIKHNPKLDGLFDVKGIWLVIRMLGFVLVNMIHFGIGPDFIIGELTGGFVMTSLLPTLLAVFLLASLLLSLLIDYGLLDFFGALLIRFMRPIFNLPGRSALNCIASWLGDGSIGVLMTSKQYVEGFYSKREAAVVATTFSAVSITFCLVVISQVGLPQMFLPFYLIVSFAGIVAAMIVPRIPPLSKIPNTYCTDVPHQEDVPAGMTARKYGLQLALEKAEKSPGFVGFCKNGVENVLEMWLGTIPVVIAMGTVALIIAEFTPVFDILGMPFIPLYQLLQIPEAQAASETVIVGFADMFLPSVIGASIESEMTRFVVAATSVTQLIYMSEIGSIIMGSKVPISFWKLFVIFLERTVVTLPIIALFAHLLF